MKILVLEDMNVRIDWLRKKLFDAKRFDIEIIHCKDYKEFCEVAPTQAWELVLFDHDLEERHYGYGEFTGTGFDAARFCAANDVEITLAVVWSVNPVGASRIVGELLNHTDCRTVSKAPFGSSVLEGTLEQWCNITRPKE